MVKVTPKQLKDFKLYPKIKNYCEKLKKKGFKIISNNKSTRRGKRKNQKKRNF